MVLIGHFDSRVPEATLPFVRILGLVLLQSSCPFKPRPPPRPRVPECLGLIEGAGW